VTQRPASARRRARRPNPKPSRRLLHIALALTGTLLLLAISAVTALAIVGWVVYHRNTDELGDINQLLTQNYGPAKIYDRNGTLLYEFEDREQGLHEDLPVGKVSPWVVKATIATEDASFYSNPGINIRGLIRAGIENFFPGKGDFLQGSGGSSITQQLVKNVLIPEEDRYDRRVDRKVKEAVLAVEVTRRYSKDQILEWYLNQIYYGNRAYGIGAAAQRYFGVSADKLDLAQASLLAGIPQAPITYDPILNFEAAKARQAQVLDLMVRHGQATAAQAEAARAAPLTFIERITSRDIKAPHWVFYIQDQLLRRYGEANVYRSGLRVTTTLDLELQEKGQAIIDQWVTEFEQQNCGCHNGALTAIDNNTGQILAMVGSRDFFRKDIQGENNNVIAIKQPGSAFKPAVYLTAFMKGWSPATIVWDVPRKYPNPGGEPFVPVGPTSSYNGPVTVRQALGSSLNAPAVSAAAYAGVTAVIDTAHKLGISTLNDPENYGVSIATGGANITLLDMTYMYSTLANGGVMVGQDPNESTARRLDPVSLLKVTDGRGRTLYEFKAPKREQTVPPQYAYLVTNILSDDSARGLIYSPGIFNLRDGRPLAAKTGTQQGYEVSQIRSTWNFGYVPDLAVGVWVGNADGTLVRNLTSASSSLRIWRDFMQYAVDYLKIPSKPFPTPQGLVRAGVTVPGAGSCRQVEDLFIAGRAPAPVATATGTVTAGAAVATGSGACRTVKIDTRNGLLANADTPEEFVKEVTFVDVPPDLDGWTPGPNLKIGVPPSVTSTATPTPTRAPTLPPRVVTAAPSVTPSPVSGTGTRPGATPGPPFFTPVPATPAASRTPTPVLPGIITPAATPAPTQPSRTPLTATPNR
jgi:membrane peptidoglycan carboxypeptidase